MMTFDACMEMQVKSSRNLLLTDYGRGQGKTQTPADYQGKPERGHSSKGSADDILVVLMSVRSTLAVQR